MIFGSLERIRGVGFTLFLSFALMLTTQVQAGAKVTEAELQKAITDVDKLAQQLIDNNVIPGVAIAIVHNDKVVFAKGYGVRDVTKPDKVDPDTVFQLASVSKSVGSTVVAELVGEGKITWDSKISDIDPEFQMFDPWVTHEITIRDFYCHRSGLPDHAGDSLEDIGYDRLQVLRRLRYQKPDSSFRSHYAYTNFGITEGAVAAAKPYGISWEDASEQKLYRPLGMLSTSSRDADFRRRANKALGHVPVDGKWVQKYNRYPDAQSPAGGVSSSVNDMARWMRLQLGNGKFEGKQIIAEKPLEETHHPQMLTQFSPLDGLPRYYGLGIGVNYDGQGRLHLDHSGAFALGASTNFSLVPSEQLGIVVLTNAFPIGVTESLTMTFVDTALNGKPACDYLPILKKVFAQMMADKGFDYSKMPIAVTPPSRNDVYVGTYTNDYFGDIQISDRNALLVFSRGPNKLSSPLTHYNRDIFTYQTEGENATGKSGLAFTLGPYGKATAVSVEDLSQSGQGEFKRVVQ